MKKKSLQIKLALKKNNVASFHTETLTGGTGNTGNCPPITIADLCRTINGCGTGTNTCPVNCPTLNVAACITNAALSCTPQGCGNSLYNC